MHRRDFLYLIGVNSLAAVLADNALARTTLKAIRGKMKLTDTWRLNARRSPRPHSSHIH